MYVACTMVIQAWTSKTPVHGRGGDRAHAPLIAPTTRFRAARPAPPIGNNAMNRTCIMMVAHTCLRQHGWATKPSVGRCDHNMTRAFVIARATCARTRTPARPQRDLAVHWALLNLACCSVCKRWARNAVMLAMAQYCAPARESTYSARRTAGVKGAPI